MSNDPTNTPPTSAEAAAEPFIDKREVARRMGRTVRAVDKMMRKGVLPYYKFDWQVAFRWSEVEAQLVRTCRVPAGSANGENIPTPHPGPLPDRGGEGAKTRTKQ